jgi:hypothetical protein
MRLKNKIGSEHKMVCNISYELIRISKTNRFSLNAVRSIFFSQTYEASMIPKCLKVLSREMDPVVIRLNR